MNTQFRKRILITGAGGPLGVNQTRSLAAAPESLWLVGTDCNRFHIPLALTNRTLLIPPAKETDAYLDALDGIIADEGIEMLLPTHPVEVRTVAQNRDRFNGVRIVLPPVASIETAQNKWKTWLLLKEGGLPVPQTFLIGDRADVDDCFDAIPTRPIWVRGAGVPGLGIGVASLPCREPDHAVSWIDYWAGWGGFIASEYLPGRNLTWLGLFNRGDLIACQGRERLEYVIPHVSPSGITGAPAVSRTIDRPDVRETGETAVRTLPGEPHGPFFVDMTEDVNGTPRITEINAGRFGTTIHFYTEAGFNFPHTLVKLAFGESIENTPIIDPVEKDSWWLRTIDCGPVLARGLDNEE